MAYEGEGQWIEYAGGYNDMLAQRGADLAKSDKITPAPKPTKEAKNRRRGRHAANSLIINNARSRPCQAKWKNCRARLQKWKRLLPIQNSTQKIRNVSKRSRSLSSAQAELATAEEEWLELELLREEIEGA